MEMVNGMRMRIPTLIYRFGPDAHSSRSGQVGTVAPLQLARLRGYEVAKSQFAYGKFGYRATRLL